MGVKEDMNVLTSTLRKTSYEEAWKLAGDILLNPEFGNAFIFFGGWTCRNDIFEDSYEHVAEVAEKWSKRPKPFDIVIVHFDDGETELAVVTQTDGEVVDLLRKGGRTCYKDITDVEKTGETFPAEDGVKWIEWMKKED